MGNGVMMEGTHPPDFFSFGALWFIITKNENVVGNIV